MRYWFDTEFIDDGLTIDLISIGIVSEDERELYLENAHFDLGAASTWVRENVFPKLLWKNMMTKAAIAESMPGNFFGGIDAEGLANWAEQEFARLPRDTSRERDRAFLALDVAAIASEARKFAPLIKQRKRTTIYWPRI